MTQAQTITSKAKSNLAFALIDLPEEERRHMAEFYAFCRTVDDIVDEPGMTPRERHDALNRWVEVINGGEGLELTELEEDIIALIQDLELDTTPMLHLIEGCRSDICQQQPRSRAYIGHRAGKLMSWASPPPASWGREKPPIRTPLPWGMPFKW